MTIVRTAHGIKFIAVSVRAARQTQVLIGIRIVATGPGSPRLWPWPLKSFA